MIQVSARKGRSIEIGSRLRRCLCMVGGEGMLMVTRFLLGVMKMWCN